MSLLDTREHPMRRLLTDAEAVVNAVQMDDSGRLIGQIWMGGNGGMLSKDTLQAVDKLRLTIATIRAEAAGERT